MGVGVGVGYVTSEDKNSDRERKKGRYRAQQRKDELKGGRWGWQEQKRFELGLDAD